MFNEGGCMKSENMLDLDLNETPNTKNEMISNGLVSMQVNDQNTSAYVNVESSETDLDDEKVVRILISLSQDMKYGEDGTNHGKKHTGKKKGKETLIDGEFEGGGRFKRSKNIDDSSKSITGKMKGESDVPLNVQRESVSSNMIGSKKVKKSGFKRNDVKPLSKIVVTSSTVEDPSEQQEEGSSSDHQAKKVVLERPNNKHKEDRPDVMRKSTQKQILKKRIKEMLLSAGWTIKLRPRNGNEHYCDAVYVSPKGKVYWSITLAYKTLQKEVENGEADSNAVPAFVPIAEKEWNSLLRISKKKLTKGGKK